MWHVVLFIDTIGAYMHVNCNKGALSLPILPLCLQHKAAAYKCDDVAALQRMAFIRMLQVIRALAHMLENQCGSDTHACRLLRLLRICLQLIKALTHMHAKH